MTYQIESGLKSLTKAGLFGSYRASHIPEWQTDMILVSDTHYLGWGFLFLMLLAFCPFLEYSHFSPAVSVFRIWEPPASCWAS